MKRWVLFGAALISMVIGGWLWTLLVGRLETILSKNEDIELEIGFNWNKS